MQLVFRMQAARACVDWGQYALLRDNVEHYLERRSHEASFAALYGVERAVDGGVGSLAAIELRRDVQCARAGLSRLTLAESAISLRTRAILSGCERTPLVRGTVLASLSGWPLPVAGADDQPLRKHFDSFVESVLALTADATLTDEVYVEKLPSRAS